MKPDSIPKLSSRIFAIGPTEFVVHEAFEIRWCCSGSYFSSLTPRTSVMSGSVAGAEMTTFFAPASRCCEAPSRSVKRPVDRDLVLSVLDFAFEDPVRGVVLEDVSEDVRLCEVVHSHDLEARVLLQVRPVEVPADAAEPVDSDFRG